MPWRDVHGGGRYQQRQRTGWEKKGGRVGSQKAHNTPPRPATHTNVDG